MFLLKNNFESFGLDIGDHTLKCAFIKKTGASFSLLSYNKIDLPAQALERGVIKNERAIIDSIKKLLAESRGGKINIPYVHACLPEVQTFIKQIDIEYGKEAEELKEAIKEELPNHIPVDIEESYLDWQIIETDEKNRRMKILVGVVPKSAADAYSKILLAADLKPVSLQIEAQAILRSITPLADPPPEPLGVVDIGATRSSFIGYEKRAIQFSFSLPFSGNKVTEQIKNNLGLSWQEAEKAKIVCGLDPEKCKGVMLEVVRAALAELKSAIVKNIEFYSEHFSTNQPIKKILLCGGGANLAGLAGFLRKNIAGCEFERANALTNLNLGPKRGLGGELEKSGSSPIYSTALGLALTNVINP